MKQVEAARAAAERLAHAVDAEAYCGWDPYDALSSPLVAALARGRFLRIAAIQSLKRSPVNVRRLLAVPKQRHTKALALFASAFARMAEGQDDRAWYVARARSLAEELLRRSIDVGSGAGWGYDFDVETRWGSYRRGRPNAVATAFVGQALMDVAALGEGAHLAAEARRAVDFALAALQREAGSERYFAYYEGGSTPIHNASVLVAALCLRASPADPRAASAAHAAFEFTRRRQRADGTWPYGEHPALSWVDGFHTAYVLDALASWARPCGEQPARSAVETGLGVYLDRLVDPDGAPRATLDHRHPVDTHAAATGIDVLTRLADLHPRAGAVADSILAWTLANLQRRDGRFAFQRGRFYRNSTPYVRWSDGHMMLALSAYLTR